MARYSTADDMRRIIGLSTISSDPDYVVDADLNYFIDKACTLMIEDFSIQKIDESMSGNINGSNTSFSVSYTPVADINFDGTINSLDVNVYGWTDTSDPSTKTSLAVTTLYPQEGKVVLTSAPASTYEDITCTYRHYLSETIRLALLPLANAYLAGWLYITSEYLLTPDQYAVGALRYNYKLSPITKALNKYYEVMNLIKTKHWTKKQHNDIKLLRG